MGGRRRAALCTRALSLLVELAELAAHGCPAAVPPTPPRTPAALHVPAYASTAHPRPLSNNDDDDHLCFLRVFAVPPQSLVYYFLCFLLPTTRLSFGCALLWCASAPSPLCCCSRCRSSLKRRDISDELVACTYALEVFTRVYSILPVSGKKHTILIILIKTGNFLSYEEMMNQDEFKDNTIYKFIMYEEYELLNYWKPCKS